MAFWLRGNRPNRRRLFVPAAALGLLAATTSNSFADDDRVARDKTAEVRPGALVPLYGGFAAFQAFDGCATLAGVRAGFVEANPMMRHAANNAAALWSLKAASTAAAVLLTERMWKTHRTGAVVTMALANGVVGSIALHNAAKLRQSR